MAKEKPYVEVCFYGDRGDPEPPNNYRPELVIRNMALIDREARFQDNGCMPKRKARAIARQWAEKLGLELKV